MATTATINHTRTWSAMERHGAPWSGAMERRHGQRKRRPVVASSSVGIMIGKGGEAIQWQQRQQ
jgi:hypothetical protein